MNAVEGFAPRAIALCLLLFGTLSAAHADSWNVSLVTLQRGGDTANAASTPRALSSADGRYVLFASTASNLVAGTVDENRGNDVFLYDRVAHSTLLVSRAAGSGNATANAGSEPTAISADGRWILFVSIASNLLDGISDSNDAADIFLFDRVSGTTTLVSHAFGTALTTADGSSLSGSISADGRWIAFESGAGNVAVGRDDNRRTDVFLYDRELATTTLVSHRFNAPAAVANDESNAPRVSADGRSVLFNSTSADLVDGVVDGNRARDVFVFDRDNGSVTLVSRAFGSAASTANGPSFSDIISADGQKIVFETDATNLVEGVADSNGVFDTYLFDRGNGTTTLVSRALDSPTTTANGVCYATALSADGRWLAFASEATNVVGAVNDDNHSFDAFVFDTVNARSTLISGALGAATSTANDLSIPVAISADGAQVLFYSYATDLLAGVTDSNQHAADTFVFDRSAGSTTLVSHRAGSATTTANALSQGVDINSDGSQVLFVSQASDLNSAADNNGQTDVFLSDRASAINTLVSRSAFTAPATPEAGDSRPFALSADGRWLLFESYAGTLVDGVADNNGDADVLLFDRSNRSTTLVSHSVGAPKLSANRGSYPAAMTPDGRWLLFSSYASDLVDDAIDTNSALDVFLFDRDSGKTLLVSRALGSTPASANGASIPKAISPDGRWVLFQSEATNLIAGVGDSNALADVFLFDRLSGSTTLVSHASASKLKTANQGATASAISADGRRVLFQSASTDLIDRLADRNGNGSDVFLFDRQSGATTLISRNSGNPLASANFASSAGGMSPDGNWIVFDSIATDVLGNVADSNGGSDVFLFDRSTSSTILVSRYHDKSRAAANLPSMASAISDDSRWIVYRSEATNAVDGVSDANAQTDLFLFDRKNGHSVLISHAAATVAATANDKAYFSAISADGQKVLFASPATDLVSGVVDKNAAMDVFQFDRNSRSIALLSHQASSSSLTANGPSIPGVMNADGSVVSFFSNATDLVSGVVDAAQYKDVFFAVSAAAGR